MGSVEQTKSRMVGLSTQDLSSGTAYLLVLENESSSIFHLPRTGDVVIGRGPEVELKLTHASVSRRHASIRVDDGQLHIADLGSHNGTRVNGEPVGASHALSSGDVATVGDVVLVVKLSQPTPLARNAYGEVGWRRRLVEEIERAVTYRRPLAVIAFGNQAPVAALAPALRLIDVVGQTDDKLPLLLLPEADREQAHAIAMQVLEAVPRAQLGLAVCPDDACDADTMLMAARLAARRAKPGAIAQPLDDVTHIALGDRRVLVADPAMVRVFALLERLAASHLPVLIMGETGVGKENAAYAVHHWSRRGGPFIAVNCAAIGPESLVESELFGHDKGAFTGAASAKAGLFESAAGGTVFLDEVGELPLAIQAKLLRALELQKITRLGEQRERAIDVRLVAATNRTLEAEVSEGRFRQDLYFRLGGATVILPPLRDRKTEIPILAHEFLHQAAARANRGPMKITPAAMQMLLTHAWTGNVRELRNTMDYVAAAAPDDVVEPSDLPERLGGPLSIAPATGPHAAVDLAAPPDAFRPINDEIRDLEKRRMVEALAAAGGVKTRAAQLIDMPIRTFTLKLKQYKL
jgi:two-component system response regulator AtoC